MMRRYSVPSVWREMDRLQREMNRLFSEYSPNQRRAAPSYPAMNAFSNENGLVITAEVPGVKPEDIDISVVGETLTLTGERQLDEVGEGMQYHRQERGYGKFTRTLQLPYPINVNGVEATFKNGVLSIHLPRAEETKPRKINVRSA